MAKNCTRLAQAYLERASRISGISVEDLKGKSRKESVSDVRKIIMILLRKRGMSSPFIGDFFSRDHATVLYHEKVANNLKATSRKFTVLYHRIQQHCYPLEFIGPDQFFTQAEEFYFSTIAQL